MIVITILLNCSNASGVKTMGSLILFKAQPLPIHLSLQRQIFINDAIRVQGGLNDEMQQAIGFLKAKLL